jgi:hypothetical protein
VADLAMIWVMVVRLVVGCGTPLDETRLTFESLAACEAKRTELLATTRSQVSSCLEVEITGTGNSQMRLHAPQSER